MINKVEIANVNTSKLQVLTNKQNKELFEKMKNGDKEVREKLIRSNSKEPTVSEIAKELELDVESVVMALDAIQDPISVL